MKHLTLLSLGLGLLTCTLSAQSPQESLSSSNSTEVVSWGADFPRTGYDEINFQLFSKASVTYNLFLESKQAPTAILKFSDQHNLLKTQLIEAESGYSSLKFEGIVAGRSDTLAYFSSFSARESQQTILMAPFHNGILGKIKPSFSYELAYTHQENPVGLNKYNKLGVVSPLYRSPDGSKLAYVQCLSRKTLNSQSDFVLAVMNDSGELLWKREIDRKKVAEYITVTDVALSNSGEVFLLTHLNSSRTFAAAAKAPHIAGYRCQVFRISENSIQDLDIYMNNGLVPLIGKLHLPQGTNGLLVVSGLYQDLTTELEQDGVFINSIQLDLQTFTSNAYPFSDFIKDDNLIHSSINNWQNYLVLRDFFEWDNGHFGFIAEVSYAQTAQRNGYGSPSRFYKQLLIPIFNLKEGLLDITSLDKSLSTFDSTTGSFAVGVNSNQLHFLYNTSGKHLVHQIKGKKVRRNTIFTMLRTLNSKGEWSEEKIVAKNTDLEKSVLARRTVFVGSQCFLVAANRKNFQVGAIQLAD